MSRLDLHLAIIIVGACSVIFIGDALVLEFANRQLKIA